MASAALGAIGGIGGPVGMAIGSVVGSIIDQQLIFPALFPADQPVPRAADLPPSLSLEGGKANLIFGNSARLPLPLVWGTAAQEDLVTESLGGKRGETTQTRWLRNLQYHVSIGACDPLQIVADGRRVWSTQTSSFESTTTRASSSTTAGIYGAIHSWFVSFDDPRTPGNRIVRGECRLIIYPTHVSGGIPYASSPDLSVYDEGGSVVVEISGVVASGSAWWSDAWEVEYSRVIDSFGVSKLILIQPFSYSAPFASTNVWPPSWDPFLLGSTGPRSLDAGLSFTLTHARVPADLKVFPAGFASVEIQDGTAKPTLLTDRLSNVPYLRDSTNLTIEQFNTSVFGNRIPNMEVIATTTDVTVHDVMSQLVLGFADVDATTCDIETLSDAETMLGIRVFAPTRIGAVIEQVGTIHNLYFQEGFDGATLSRFRNGPDRDTVTITADQLNPRLPDSDFDPEDLDLRILSPEERPASVSVSYSNPDNAWQRGDASWNANTTTAVGQPVSIQLVDATLTKERAQEVADRIGMQAWSRIREATFMVPWAFATMQTDDICVVTARDGQEYDILVSQVDFDPAERATVTGYVVDLEAFLTADPSSLTPSLAPTGTEDGLRYRSDRIYADGIPEDPLSHCPIVGGIAQIEPMRDEHAGIPGFYAWASTGNRSLVFQGAVLMVKREGSDCWRLAGMIQSPAKVGITVDALASGSGYDVTNTVNVYMQSGEPESTTSDLCADSANRYLIGDEVVGVVTVTPGDDFAYEFSDLHRGMMDTTAAAAAHESMEQVVLLDDSVVFVPISVEDIGTVMSVAFVPPGLSIDDVVEQFILVAPRTCTPRTPASVSLVDGGTSLTASWTYQSLRNARFLTPAQDPRESGDRIICQFWNSTIAAISGLPDYEVEVDVLEDSLTLTAPADVGLDGPNIAVRVFVRSNEWGDGDYGEDEVAANYTATVPADVNLIDLADTPAGYGSAGQILVSNGSTEFVLGNIEDVANAGGAAQLDVGTTSGTVAAGDDVRFVAVTKHLGLFMRRLALPEAGTTAWTSSTSGTGTSFYANQPQYNAEQRVATILQTHILQVGSAASGTNAIVARQSSLALQWLFDGFRFVVRLFVNTTSGISSCRVGMWGNAATPAATGRPGYGLWLEYDPTTLGNGNWWLCAANGGAVTTSDTGVALDTTQRVFVVEQTTTSLGKVWELVTSTTATRATVASALPSGSVAQDVTAFSQVTRDNAGGTSTKVFIPDFGILPTYAGLEYAIPS